MHWNTVDASYGYTHSSRGLALLRILYYLLWISTHPVYSGRDGFAAVVWPHTTHASPGILVFSSNLTTISTTNSVPPRAKACDVLLFLYSCILQLMVTRTAVKGLHYLTFCVLHVYSIASHTSYTCSVATWQLQTLRTRSSSRKSMGCSPISG